MINSELYLGGILIKSDLMTTTEWQECWKKPVKVQYRPVQGREEVLTLESREGAPLIAKEGIDVIIKGVKGEVYPCKIEVFNQTYTTLPPLTESQTRADTAKEIFAKLDKLMPCNCGHNESVHYIANGSCQVCDCVGFELPDEYLTFKEKYVIE